MLGVLSLEDALAKARSAGLDLVEVSPTADPPVCKILDYGKFKFQSQKKKKEARKKQKVVHIKELKIRPNIGEHDYQTKLNHARKFIEKEDKVKVTLRFRGREITHKDVAEELFHRFVADMEDIAKPEVPPKMEGKQMVMVMAPLH